MAPLDKVARNTFYQAASHAFGLAVAVATTTMVARYLDVGSFGTYSLLAVVFALLGGISTGSLETVAVRSLAGRNVPVPGWVERLLGLRLAVSSALAAAAVAVALLAPVSTDVRLAVLVLAGVSTLGALQGTLLCVFQARLQFAVPALIDAATRLVILLGYLLVLFVLVPEGEPMVAAAVMPQLFGATAGLVLTVRAVRRAGVGVGLAFGRAEWRQLAGEAAPLAGLQVLGVVNYRLDIVVLGVLLGTDAAGIYGIAYRFVDAALPLAAFVAASLFPLLASELDVGAERVRRAALLVLAAAPVVVVPALLFAPRIVELVGGRDYAAAALPLRLLVLSLPFSALAMLLLSLVMAHRRERTVLPLVVGSIVLNLSLNLVLVPTYGVAGAAGATLCAEITGCLLLLRLVRRVPGVSLPLPRPRRAAALGRGA